MQMLSGYNYNPPVVEDIEPYDYGDINLSPDGELHKDIVNSVMSDSIAAYNAISSRHSDWEKIDQTLNAFITPTEEETLRQTLDENKPISIVVPVSFALRETLLTQYMALLLSLPTYFPYVGVGPEDTVGALIMRHLVQQQILRGQGDLAFYVQAMDALTYGIGICVPKWHREVQNVVTSVPTGITTLEGEFKQTGNAQSVEEKVIWEGNVFENVDAYKYLPHPSFPAHKMQSSSSTGWVSTESYFDLLSRELSGAEGLINVRYLRKNAGVSMFSSDESGRINSSTSDLTNQDEDIVTVVWRYYTLIPREWKLGDSDKPEKWIFAIANDKIVIKAQRLALKHNKYPASVMAPDFDGHSISPKSKLEMVYGLQGWVNFILNMRMAELVKTVGGNYIYDPWRLNSRDIRRPGWSKYIRTRKTFWGQGVKDVIEALPVTNATEGHITLVPFLFDLMQRIAGANNPLQGVLDQNAPERRTKAEFQGTMQGAISRLSNIARLMYIQGMRDLGIMAAAHTSQFLRRDSYIQVAGELERVLVEQYGLGDKISQGLLAVSPDQIDINVDIAPVNFDNTSIEDPQVAMQLFQVISADPQLSMVYDRTRMFESLSRQLGMPNMEDMRVPLAVQQQRQIEAKILPDNQVADMQSSGKLRALV